MYAKPSTCAIGRFLVVIGGALVELYDTFITAFLNLVFDSSQGLRISSSVLPSYHFVTNYQVGTLRRKVESSTSLLDYCSCFLLFFSGAIVRGYNACLSEPLYVLGPYCNLYHETSHSNSQQSRTKLENLNQRSRRL